VLDLTCSFLPVGPLLCLGAACKHLHELAEVERFWQSLCIWKWPNTSGLTLPSFKAFYMRRVGEPPAAVPLVENDFSLLLDVKMGDTSLCSQSLPL
jgi:hypothetical protein